MRYPVDIEDLARRRAAEPGFTGARIFLAAYRTDPQAVADSLPPGFTPAEVPTASVFVAEYPETNFGSVYREAALMVACSFAGEPGNLCLGMVVDDDTALIGGREVYGFPKKMADIRLAIEGSRVRGSAARRGITFLEIAADLSAPVDLPAPPTTPIFLVKGFPSAALDGLEWAPKVVRMQNRMTTRETRLASGLQVTLRESELDRWAAIPAVEPILGAHVVADFAMTAGRVVGELDPIACAPWIVANSR
jgi:acetoacetate decarboxylase